ncbi:hypothetical protein [Teredinibacter haidensis]|uniref:hypothetical protein n=1 Tax=Teredinibacter haidensis TaxID=2731755 RepID=UPI000948E17B|nr:hypothetical protein [Teredinibacter haidensis]
MVRILKTTLIIFALALLGCATGPKFKPAPAAPEGYATIYFLNFSFDGLAYPPRLFCANSEKVASLRFGGYTSITAKPGEYIFNLGGILNGCLEDYINAKSEYKISGDVKSGGIYIVQFYSVDSGNYITYNMQFGKFEEKSTPKERLQNSRYNQPLRDNI